MVHSSTRLSGRRGRRDRAGIRDRRRREASAVSSVAAAWRLRAHRAFATSVPLAPAGDGSCASRCSHPPVRRRSRECWRSSRRRMSHVWYLLITVVLMVVPSRSGAAQSDNPRHRIDHLATAAAVDTTRSVAQSPVPRTWPAGSGATALWPRLRVGQPEREIAAATKSPYSSRVRWSCRIRTQIAP